MKRLEIFDKARYLYEAGLVEMNKITDKNIYFNVCDEDTINSVIVHTQDGVSIDCDCTHSALKTHLNMLCSHRIAVILYLCHKRGRVKK